MLGVKLVENEFDDDVVLEAQNFGDPFSNPRLDRTQVNLRHINLEHGHRHRWEQALMRGGGQQMIYIRTYIYFTSMSRAPSDATMNTVIQRNE